MTSLFRNVQWWLQRRRKEEELHEELQFHLAVLRSLPVADPSSLVVVKWRSRPITSSANGRDFVMHGGRRPPLPGPLGHHRRDLPIPSGRAAPGDVGAGPVQPLRT